jgi:hypothetical protein
MITDSQWYNSRPGKKAVCQRNQLLTWALKTATGVYGNPVRSGIRRFFASGWLYWPIVMPARP